MPLTPLFAEQSSVKVRIVNNGDGPEVEFMNIHHGWMEKVSDFERVIDLVKGGTFLRRKSNGHVYEEV